MKKNKSKKKTKKLWFNQKQRTAIALYAMFVYGMLVGTLIMWALYERAIASCP